MFTFSTILGNSKKGLFTLITYQNTDFFLISENHAVRVAQSVRIARESSSDPEWTCTYSTPATAEGRGAEGRGGEGRGGEGRGGEGRGGEGMGGEGRGGEGRGGEGRGGEGRGGEGRRGTSTKPRKPTL